MDKSRENTSPELWNDVGAENLRTGWICSGKIDMKWDWDSDEGDNNEV